MPILDVELVGAEDQDATGELAQQIADSAGTLFGTPAGRTWVRLRFLPREMYAENGGSLPSDLRPVFVDVLKAHRPEGNDLKVEVEALTRAIAEATGRPHQNVHVCYREGGAGRVAFGGQLVS